MAEELGSVWEDNGALYHALLALSPAYQNQCSAQEIVSSHERLTNCLQTNLAELAGPYTQRSYPHVRFLSPRRTDGVRGMAFWDREWSWSHELQFNNGDFMVHTKDVARYTDPKLRTSCVHATE